MFVVPRLNMPALEGHAGPFQETERSLRFEKLRVANK